MPVATPQIDSAYYVGHANRTFWDVRVPKTLDEYAQGYKGVTSIHDHECMLFVYPSLRKISITMEGCLLDLWVVFLGLDNEVVWRVLAKAGTPVIECPVPCKAFLEFGPQINPVPKVGEKLSILRL